MFIPSSTDPPIEVFFQIWSCVAATNTSNRSTLFSQVLLVAAACAALESVHVLTSASNPSSNNRTAIAFATLELLPRQQHSTLTLPCSMRVPPVSWNNASAQFRWSSSSFKSPTSCRGPLPSRVNVNVYRWFLYISSYPCFLKNIHLRCHVHTLLKHSCSCSRYDKLFLLKKCLRVCLYTQISKAVDCEFQLSCKLSTYTEHVFNLWH